MKNLLCTFDFAKQMLKCLINLECYLKTESSGVNNNVSRIKLEIFLIGDSFTTCKVGGTGGMSEHIGH